MSVEELLDQVTDLLADVIEDESRRRAKDTGCTVNDAADQVVGEMALRARQRMARRRNGMSAVLLN